MDRESPNNLGMTTPATYQIIVKGKLDDNWTDWFNVTNISHSHSMDTKPQTTFTCQVKDQAELLGILNHLNGLHLPLMQVICIQTEA